MLIKYEKIIIFNRRKIFFPYLKNEFFEKFFFLFLICNSTLIQTIKITRNRKKDLEKAHKIIQKIKTFSLVLIFSPQLLMQCSCQEVQQILSSNESSIILKFNELTRKVFARTVSKKELVTFQKYLSSFSLGNSIQKEQNISNYPLLPFSFIQNHSKGKNDSCFSGLVKTSSYVKWFFSSGFDILNLVITSLALYKEEHEILGVSYVSIGSALYVFVLLTNLYEVIYKNHYQIAEKNKQKIELLQDINKIMKEDLELYLKNDEKNILKIFVKKSEEAIKNIGSSSILKNSIEKLEEIKSNLLYLLQNESSSLALKEN